MWLQVRSITSICILVKTFCSGWIIKLLLNDFLRGDTLATQVPFFTRHSQLSVAIFCNNFSHKYGKHFKGGFWSTLWFFQLLLLSMKWNQRFGNRPKKCAQKTTPGNISYQLPTESASDAANNLFVHFFSFKLDIRLFERSSVMVGFNQLLVAQETWPNCQTLVART